MNVYNWNDPVPFVGPEKTEPVLECEDAVVKCLALDPGKQAPVHRHQMAVDVMVIVKGGGVATVNGKECRVGPGDVILNPKGTLHGIRNDGEDQLVWVVIQAPPPNRMSKPKTAS